MIVGGGGVPVCITLLGKTNDINDLPLDLPIYIWMKIRCEIYKKLLLLQAENNPQLGHVQVYRIHVK
jgi:hypothetical protein